MDIDTESDSIWHLLLDNGVCDENQLKEAYEEHEQNGKHLSQIIINYGLISEDDYLQLIAETIGSETIDLQTIDPPLELIELIPSHIARMYQIIPVKIEHDTVYVAAADALNYRMIDELQYVIGKDVVVLVAKLGGVETALDHFYPRDSESMSDVLDSLITGDLDDIDENSDVDDEELANSTPIVRFVDVIVFQAVKDRASDIHFEPFADEFKIRYRVDGALYELAPPPVHLAIPVVSRIKVISNMNLSERRMPQDGKIEMRINGKPIDLRVSTLPTVYGESVCLRILDRSNTSLSLESLGFEEEFLATLTRLIKQPNGIMAVTGPTGSGKTTTLYSCLNEVNDIGEKLLTAEDPVEYDIEGIMQVPISEAIGLTYAKTLKAFLRQDPDRIMVGEIRDMETATIAIQAALTGHLVFSTLHTNDSAGSVTRLIDMGIQPFLISSSLIGVLAQRLLRRVCENCKTEYEPSDKELIEIDIEPEDAKGRKIYYGKGCDECNDSGYYGRVGIFELLEITSAIKKLITQVAPTSIIKEAAVKEGMLTMRHQGIRYILDGVTTIEEVKKYT